MVLVARPVEWSPKHRSVKDGTDPEEYLVAAPGYVTVMYEGKEPLRPIYDSLLELGRSARTRREGVPL